MNEVIIVVNHGDNINDLIKTAMDIVKINTVSYALITFNEVKVFIKKDATEESAMDDYMQRLKNYNSQY